MLPETIATTAWDNEMSKQTREATGLRLTPGALAKLDGAADRLGRSRASIVEILALMYADRLQADTMIPASALPGDSRAKKTSRKIATES